MEFEISEIEKYGERLVKFKDCPSNTEHLFFYKYKGEYFIFYMIKGEYFNTNKSKINKVKGLGMKLSVLRDWYNSPSNEWFSHDHKLYDGRYTIEPLKAITYSKKKMVNNGAKQK